MILQKLCKAKYTKCENNRSGASFTYAQKVLHNKDLVQSLNMALGQMRFETRPQSCNEALIRAAFFR